MVGRKCCGGIGDIMSGMRCVRMRDDGNCR